MAFRVSLRALHERTPTASEDVAIRRVSEELRPFGNHVARVAVRLEPAVRGRKSDARCVLEIATDAGEPIVAEEHGRGAVEAIERATASAAQMLEERFGAPEKARRGGRPEKRARDIEVQGRGTRSGSLMGRRVGQGSANLAVARFRPEKIRRDVPVDTAAPGTAADDRIVGKNATATRNTKGKSSGLAYALEDSATGKASRKSTRKSTNRTKPDSNLRRREQRRVRSPKTRAMKGKARGERATK